MAGPWTYWAFRQKGALRNLQEFPSCDYAERDDHEVFLFGFCGGRANALGCMLAHRCRSWTNSFP